MSSPGDITEEDNTPFTNVRRRPRAASSAKRHLASSPRSRIKQAQKVKKTKPSQEASTSHNTQPYVQLEKLQIPLQLQTQQTLPQQSQPQQSQPQQSQPQQSYQQQTPQSEAHAHSLLPPRHNTISKKMQEITHPQCTHAYTITTNEHTNRLTIADAWSTLYPHRRDEIIKTSKGFLLKSNEPSEQTTQGLINLISNKIIINFGVVDPKAANKPTEIQREPNATYSVVVHGVETEIPDIEISNHLKSINLQHRYCKRIIAKATNRETRMIRIITGQVTTFEQLLANGIYFKCRHYAVEPSKPPTPIPTPCGKCSQFTHTTEKCLTPIKCLKCGAAHSTSNCQTELPIKCGSCNVEGHVAWSIKCPSRPINPINGIPNVKIKTLNKKSLDIDTTVKTQHSRIHSPITLHDIIINTYTNKINKPNNIDRETLLKKLKHKFIQEHNVDTTVIFSGNRMYVMMFDLTIPNSTTATQPTDNAGVKQVELIDNAGQNN